MSEREAVIEQILAWFNWRITCEEGRTTLDEDYIYHLYGVREKVRNNLTNPNKRKEDV